MCLEILATLSYLNTNFREFFFIPITINDISFNKNAGISLLQHGFDFLCQNMRGSCDHQA